MTTVLCVDNDACLTAILRYALTREGYAVRMANRGLVALQ
jgi:DNA-binding response OmpR family regulator